jgi:hypothetical protein
MPDFIGLGREAAQASRDAHDGVLVDAAMAYDFITNMATEEPLAVPAWDALPMEFKIGFLEGYYDDGGAR